MLGPSKFQLLDSMHNGTDHNTKGLPQVSSHLIYSNWNGRHISIYRNLINHSNSPLYVLYVDLDSKIIARPNLSSS